MKADFGYMLCCGLKWLGNDKVEVPSLKEFPGKKLTDDSKLCQHIVDRINEADIIVTYYGRRYDIPFINTRQIRANKTNFIILPDASHIDLWETVKKRLKLHSNRLVSVIDFLDLDNQKTPVKGQEWIDAMAGYEKARQYVIAHCRKDVLALEEAYLIVRPLIHNHPRIKVAAPTAAEYPCPNCGSARTKSRGLSVTTSKLRKQRRICTDCGTPFFGRIERI